MTFESSGRKGLVLTYFNEVTILLTRLCALFIYAELVSYKTLWHMESSSYWIHFGIEEVFIKICKVVMFRCYNTYFKLAE